MSLIDKLKRTRHQHKDRTPSEDLERDHMHELADLPSYDHDDEADIAMNASDKGNSIRKTAIFKQRTPRETGAGKNKRKKPLQETPSVHSKRLPTRLLLVFVGGLCVVCGAVSLFIWPMFVPNIAPITVNATDKNLTPYNNKLIYIQGNISGDTILKDPVFMVQADNGLGLQRIVETYQWSENGKEKLWSQDLITPPRGYKNPQRKYFNSENYAPKNLYIGGIALNEHMREALGVMPSRKYILTQEDYNNLPAKGKRAFSLTEDGTLIWTDNPLSPKIGSVRISFNITDAPIVSYLGSVKNGKASIFKHPEQSIFAFNVGATSVEQLIGTNLPTDPDESKRIYARASVIGYALILLGLLLVFLPFLRKLLASRMTKHNITASTEEDPEHQDTRLHTAKPAKDERRRSQENHIHPKEAHSHLDGDMLYDIEKDLENIPSEVEIIRYKKKDVTHRDKDLLPDLPDFEDDEDDDIKPAKEVADIRNIPSFNGNHATSNISEVSEDLPAPPLNFDDEDEDEDDLPAPPPLNFDDEDEDDLPAPPPLNFDDEDEDDLPAPPPLNFDDEDEDEDDLPAPPPLNFDDEGEDEDDLPAPPPLNFDDEGEDEDDLSAPPPLNFDDEDEDDLPAPPPLNFDDEDEDDLPAPPPLNFDDEDEDDLPAPPPLNFDDEDEDDLPAPPPLNFDDEDEDDLPAPPPLNFDDEDEDEDDLPAPPPLNFDDEDEDEDDLPAPPPLNFDDEDEDEDDLPAPPPLNFDDEDEDEDDLPAPPPLNFDDNNNLPASGLDDETIAALLKPDAAPIKTTTSEEKTLPLSGTSDKLSSPDIEEDSSVKRRFNVTISPSPKKTDEDSDDDDFIPLGRMGDPVDPS